MGPLRRAFIQENPRHGRLVIRRGKPLPLLHQRLALQVQVNLRQLPVQLGRLSGGQRIYPLRLTGAGAHCRFLHITGITGQLGFQLGFADGGLLLLNLRLQVGAVQLKQHIPFLHLLAVRCHPRRYP
ncbi:hypothetical protein D3C75_1043830 [compost metagenome]